MNEARFQMQMENATVVREVIELAGLDLETALVTLEAVSDEQRNFAGFVRHAGIADIWKWGVDKEYKTPEFAQTLIRAANHHKTAKWWIDREPHTLAIGGFMSDLEDNIEEEFHG